MRSRLHVALATLLVAALLSLLSPTPPAAASCIETVPARLAASLARRDIECSHMKHKSEDHGWFDVRCQHDDWYERIRLYPGQNTYDTYPCQRGFDYVWIMAGTQLWCKRLFTTDPFVLYWTAGGRPWNHWTSLNCKVVDV